MGTGLPPEQNRIFSDISHYLDDTKSISEQSIHHDRDNRNFYALSMVLFALSNRLIDLAREVVYCRGYAKPEEQLKNKVLFKRLSDYNIIDSSLKQELIRLVDFRNLCSHHFQEVTKNDLIWVMESLPQYEIFVIQMREELFRKNQITAKKILLAAGVVVLVILILLLLLFLL